MAKRGRPSTGSGKAVWVPNSLAALVEALKAEDKKQAIILFSEWVDKTNKH